MLVAICVPVSFYNNAVDTYLLHNLVAYIVYWLILVNSLNSVAFRTNINPKCSNIIIPDAMAVAGRTMLAGIDLELIDFLFFIVDYYVSLSLRP